MATYYSDDILVEFHGPESSCFKKYGVYRGKKEFYDWIENMNEVHYLGFQNVAFSIGDKVVLTSAVLSQMSKRTGKTIKCDGSLNEFHFNDNGKICKLRVLERISDYKLKMHINDMGISKVDLSFKEGMIGKAPEKLKAILPRFRSINGFISAGWFQTENRNITMYSYWETQQIADESKKKVENLLSELSPMLENVNPTVKSYPGFWFNFRPHQHKTFLAHSVLHMKPDTRENFNRVMASIIPEFAKIEGGIACGGGWKPDNEVHIIAQYATKEAREKGSEIAKKFFEELATSMFEKPKRMLHDDAFCSTGIDAFTYMAEIEFHSEADMEKHMAFLQTRNHCANKSFYAFWKVQDKPCCCRCVCYTTPQMFMYSNEKMKENAEELNIKGMKSFNAHYGGITPEFVEREALAWNENPGFKVRKLKACAPYLFLPRYEQFMEKGVFLCSMRLTIKDIKKWTEALGHFRESGWTGADTVVYPIEEFQDVYQWYQVWRADEFFKQNDIFRECTKQYPQVLDLTTSISTDIVGFNIEPKVKEEFEQWATALPQMSLFFYEPESFSNFCH